MHVCVSARACVHTHTEPWNGRLSLSNTTYFPKSDIWTVQGEWIPSLQLPGLIKRKRICQQTWSDLPFPRFLQVTVFNRMCRKSMRQNFISKGATTILASAPLLSIQIQWANHVLAPYAENNTQRWWAKCVLSPQPKLNPLYAFLRDK